MNCILATHTRPTDQNDKSTPSRCYQNEFAPVRDDNSLWSSPPRAFQHPLQCYINGPTLP